MKKIIWSIALIGVIILVIAPIWSFAILPPQLIMPEDVDESVTYTGEASVANPQNLTQLAGPFDLTINRSYVGIDTTNDGNAVILEETAVVNIDSPFTPPQTEKFIMAVDRKTYEHLNEDDEKWDHPRYGKFTFGLHPPKEDVDFWLHDINDTVVAKYDGTTTYEGFSVIKYSMKDTRQITKNAQLIDTYAGMAYYYGNSYLNGLYFKEDSYVYVDEISGIILYIDRNTELVGDFTHIPSNMNFNVTLSKMSYKFDEVTSDKLLKDARAADDNIVFVETIIPITIIVIGAVILIIGIVFIVYKKRKEKRAQTD